METKYRQISKGMFPYFIRSLDKTNGYQNRIKALQNKSKPIATKISYTKSCFQNWKYDNDTKKIFRSTDFKLWFQRFLYKKPALETLP
jgi:hypothetical protein